MYFGVLPWTTNCRHCSYCARKVCKCFWSKMRILASTTTARKADHYHACFRVICHKVAHLSLQHIQVLFFSDSRSNEFQNNTKIRYASCFLKQIHRQKCAPSLFCHFGACRSCSFRSLILTLLLNKTCSFSRFQ